jgi:hypothetical protein
MPLYHKKGDWNRVVRGTNDPKKKPVARYIPSLSHDDIRQMEFDCVQADQGTPRPIAPNKRGLWRKMPQVIGASLGQETCFIYVELMQSGDYHGRPITADELKEKGVAWNLLT